MSARHPLGNQYFLPTAERPDDKMDIRSYDAENIPPVTASLRKILQMNAETSEEKFKLLDARDKLFKIMRDRDPSLKRGALVATCPDMCPEKERLLREYQNRGSMFEMTNFCKNSSFNHSLAVKEYARSSADQEEPLPQDLRPVHVLTMTMSHLLHNVVDFCELSDDNLEEWYMFMWDRTRALRKELTQQEVCNLEAVTLVEQCARFHIHCAERLVDQDSSIYDDKINTENLTKCLQTLKYLYKDLAKEDIKCPNESEFICYTLLLNLNNSSVFTELSDMSDSFMASGPVRFALDVMTAWVTQNYIKFFSLVKKTTYLNCCLLRRYFGEMRLHAIRTMICSYCTKNYSPQIPLSRFVENLNFEGEEECIQFLSHCNFNFREVGNKTVVNFERILFQNPTTTFSSGRAYIFIEEKKQRPLSVIMAGGTLPPKLFENYSPQNSFTANGELKPESLMYAELKDFLSVPPTNFKADHLDSKTDSNKSSGLAPVFQKRDQTEPIRDPRLAKRIEESIHSSSSPLFSQKDKNALSSNIFGSVQTSIFGKNNENTNVFGQNFQSVPSSNAGIFDSSKVNQLNSNIFGNQGSSLFSNNANKMFGAETKTFSGFSFNAPSNQKEGGGEPQTKFGEPAVLSTTNSSNFGTVFQFKSNKYEEELKMKEEQKRNEKLEMERLEREKMLKEKEEEENRKRKEEEKARMLLEMKKSQEENQKRELERKEREKREEEERLKKELDRLERKEKCRLEELERQERLKKAKAEHLAELKRLEESKHKAELEFQRKVDEKMSHLKKKLQKWKTKIIFQKWRMKTWSSIEERKMKEYFKEVKHKYPPVCSEEILNGNPYGMLIPSILSLEKFQNWKKEFPHKKPEKTLIVNDGLPLLKVNCILEKALEERAKSLGNVLDPFPWKLVISVPDELESPQYSKSIETFVEMHFVEDFSWQFGIQKGPLYCRSGCRGSFRYTISIRKLRGCKLFEGIESNSSATRGSNGLVFFMTEEGNEITWERLREVLKSRPPLPKIPVILFVLNSQSEQQKFKELLESKSVLKTHVSEYQVIFVTNGRDHLVSELIKSLSAVAKCSAPTSMLRISQISTFFTGSWLDSLWRRIEISLSNFKLTLHEPKVLIEFYNASIEELGEIFLDESYNELTILGQEFSESTLNPPHRSPAYREKLTSTLRRLKLPHWPAETPKSSHQLNYRIHQYCKKIVDLDKKKIKNLKWVLYRIIRRSLLWKGLDIYCDEDISDILVNFPWVQVFQEISKVKTFQLSKEAENEGLVIIYDLERIARFSFESSFISKFLNKPSKSTPKKSHLFGDEIKGSSPCLEKDSIVYAYSAALERETFKRKREECIDESLDALFSLPTGKRMILDEPESKPYDCSQIESSFQSLDDRLDDLKKRMLENSKLLMNIHSQMQ